jgi:DNA mismatch repair protein MutS2
MRAAMRDLVRTEARPAGGAAVITTHERAREALRDLDLRGMTGEEALPLVDKFIDDAVLAGLNRIDIIHGKGTGALRKRVTEFLAQHPRVRSYRFAEWNEGGTGATVVELGGE